MQCDQCDLTCRLIPDPSVHTHTHTGSTTAASLSTQHPDFFWSAHACFSFWSTSSELHFFFFFWLLLPQHWCLLELHYWETLSLQTASDCGAWTTPLGSRRKCLMQCNMVQSFPSIEDIYYKLLKPKRRQRLTEPESPTTQTLLPSP